jgi:hypothetical protein
MLGLNNVTRQSKSLLLLLLLLRGRIKVIKSKERRSGDLL